MIGLLLTIVVVGVLLWLVEAYVPMDATVKKVLVAVVVIALVLYVLQAFGVLGAINAPVPRIR